MVAATEDVPGAVDVLGTILPPVRFLVVFVPRAAGPLPFAFCFGGRRGGILVRGDCRLEWGMCDVEG